MKESMGTLRSIEKESGIPPSKSSRLNNHTIFDILRYIVDFIPDAVFAVDSMKVIVAWNRAMEHMTEIPRETVIGQDLQTLAETLYGRPRHTLIDLLLEDDPKNKQRYHIIQEDDSISGESFVPWVYSDTGAHLWAKASLLRDISGCVIGAVETIRDVTEWKQAKTSLCDSEEKHQKLIAMLRDVVYTTDRDGKLTYLSPGFEEVTGYSLDDVIGRPFTDFLLPQYREEALRLFSGLVKRGETSSFDAAIRGKVGNVIPVELRGVPLFDRDGENIGRIGIARDITDRKRAEKALEESEANYRQLFENAPAGIYRVDFKTGKFLKANDVFREYLCCSKEELNSLSPYDILTEESRGLFLERVEKMARGEDVPEIVEYEIVNKRGRRYWVHLHSNNIYDAEGAVVASDVIAHDITERKETERALRESEERYRMIVENMHEIIWTMDLDFNYTYRSPANIRITGYSPEEITTLPVSDQIVPESYALVEKILAEELENEFGQGPVDLHRSRTLEIEVYHKDGGTVWIEVTGTFIRDDGGQPVEILLTARDITERKRLEGELEESERLYRTIFETTGTATMIIEEDATISLVNKEFERLSGYAKEEVEGKKRWMDFVYEPDLDRMLHENRKRKVRDPSVFRSYEFRALHKGGTIRDALLNVSMIPDSGRMVASLHDITEQKQSEVLTRSQRDLAERLNMLTRLDDVLRTCAETAMHISWMECGGIYLVDEETGGLHLIYHEGLSDEFVEQISYYPPDSDNVRLVEQGGPVYCRYGDLEADLSPLDVDEHLTSVAVVPIHFEGRPIACLNVASRTIETIPDFTRTALESISSQVGVAVARVKAEEASRKSEEMFRALAENSSDVIMRFDRQFRHLYASSGVEKETGIPSREFIGKTHHELGFPEDLVNMAEAAIQKVFETGQPNRVEFMLPSAIWLDWLLVPEFAGNGGVKAVMTSSRDITGRKLREIREKEEKDRLARENVHLRSSMKDRWRFGGIIGKSGVMQEVYDLMEKAAASDASVIIYGESGTGKELVARAIHDMSARKKGEFVPVNCGAIPENLLESEFFGHRKGAYTGAHIDKHGYLDLADGGSLFLDEIGELGLNIQVKLLRALEGGGYTPLGSAREKHSDFRIIAATNRDLADHVKRGVMREDFFYRIHIVPITLPPLRDRREDIPLLIEHFLKQNASENGTIKLSGKAMETLYYHDWPGNVRELQNVLHRYLTIRSLDFMSPSSNRSPIVTGPGWDDGDDADIDLATALERHEKEIIVRVLEAKKWHRIRAAEALGISRHTLFRKMKNYELL